MQSRSPETPFTRRVHAVVRRVPVGRVVTYGDVARLAGRPGAARAVGNIMQQARAPGLPYHRVIAAGGQLGGYGGNLGLKRALLVAEGLVVTATRVKNFARIRWPGPSKTAPGPSKARTNRRSPPYQAKTPIRS